MANIKWNNQAFTPVKFNPSLGFAAAGKTFGNIADSLRDRQEAEAEAAALAEQRLFDNTMAERKQAYTEDTPARLLAAANEKGVLANDIIQNAGGSRSDKLFSDMMNTQDPKLRAITGLDAGQSGPMQEGGFKVFDDYVQDNKAMVSDPDTYRQQVKAELLSSGKFSGPEADAQANAATAKLFPTASNDLIKMRLKALADQPGGASKGSSSGSGGSGTFKPWSSQPTVMQEKDIHENFMNMYPDINKKDDGLLSFDVGAPDITGPKMRRLSSTMKQEGINPAATYAVMEKYLFDGSNAPFDPDNMTGDQIKDFKIEAQQMMDQNRQGYNSKTGAAVNNVAAQNAQNKQYLGDVDKIFATGTTPNYSDEELVQSFLGSIGGGAPAQAPAPAPQVAPQAAPVVAPPQAAAQAGIMPAPNVADIMMGTAPQATGTQRVEGTDPLLANLTDTAAEGNIKGIDINSIPDESLGTATMGTALAGVKGVGNVVGAGANLIGDGVKGAGKILSGIDDKLQASKKRTGELSKKVGKQQTDRYAKEVLKKINKQGNIKGINRFHLMESLGSDLLTPADKAIVQRFLDNS